jgi:hypothetical protein
MQRMTNLGYRLVDGLGIDVHPLVSRRFDLDKVMDAFAFAADNPARNIKLMVRTA